MHKSLIEKSSNCHLYIFAFDDESYSILNSLKLSKVTTISLSKFETPELLEIKKHRTVVEYCWTSTPSIIKFCIKKYNLENCTYIDADLFFYSDPSILIEEMADKSILITEHRYSWLYNRSKKYGKYCVQFMTFKNTVDGLKVLNWWQKACNEWCFNRVEDGKFGDQKYLDDWPDRFEGVHILKNEGGGLAPWNIQQYQIQLEPHFHLMNKRNKQKINPVFFHFHHINFYEKNIIDIGNYKISKTAFHLFYQKYFSILNEIRLVQLKEHNGNYHGIDKINLMVIIKQYIRLFLIGTKNRYRFN